MSDQGFVRVTFEVIFCGGVETTAALVRASEGIHTIYEVYRKERRDLNDPYAFLEFCIARYDAEIVFPSDKTYWKKELKSEKFNFNVR